MTLSSAQELPNRMDASDGTAILGTGTGTDTSDPLNLAHEGEHYVIFHGLTDNRATSSLALTDTSPTATVDIRVDIDTTGLPAAATARLVEGHFGIQFSPAGLMSMFLRKDVGGFIVPTTTVNALTGITGRYQFRGLYDVAAETYAAYKRPSGSILADDDNWTLIEGGIAASLGGDGLGFTNVPIIGGQTGAGTKPIPGATFAAYLKCDNEVFDFNPGRDIDAASDPDAGQTSFASTGPKAETWTINRATSGLVTTVVTRPVLVFDGSNDYLQLAASRTPTVTATSGKTTIVVAWRRHNDNDAETFANAKVFSSESVDGNGLYLNVNPSDNLVATLGGSGTPNVSTAAVAYTQKRLNVSAAVKDTASLALYLDSSGLGAAVDTTGVTGAVTHGQPRIGSRADAVAHAASMEVFHYLAYDNETLSEDQLDTLAAKLRSGDYA